MKDEEFKNFDHKPEISYTITGQQPFDTGYYWTKEVKVYTFDKAIENLTEIASLVSNNESEMSAVLPKRISRISSLSDS